MLTNANGGGKMGNDYPFQKGPPTQKESMKISWGSFRGKAIGV